jgi:hypothetical protein
MKYTKRCLNGSTAHGYIPWSSAKALTSALISALYSGSMQLKSPSQHAAPRCQCDRK